jgi:hypothetical protein
MSEPTQHSEFLVPSCRRWGKNAPEADIQSAVRLALDAPPDSTGKFLRDREVIA